MARKTASSLRPTRVFKKRKALNRIIVARIIHPALPRLPNGWQSTSLNQSYCAARIFTASIAQDNPIFVRGSQRIAPKSNALEAVPVNLGRSISLNRGPKGREAPKLPFSEQSEAKNVVHRANISASSLFPVAGFRYRRCKVQHWYQNTIGRRAAFRSADS